MYYISLTNIRQVEISYDMSILNLNNVIHLKLGGIYSNYIAVDRNYLWAGEGVSFLELPRFKLVMEAIAHAIHFKFAGTTYPGR